jgi:hypothetical protein
MASPASRPGRFIPVERAPGAYWLGGRLSPRASLDAVEWRIIYFLCQETNPGRPSRSPSLYQLSYPSSCTVTETTFFSDRSRSSVFPSRLKVITDFNE